jgi:hypothetical protein
MNGRTYNPKIIEGYPRNIDRYPQDGFVEEFSQEYDILPEKYRFLPEDPEEKNITTGGGDVTDINHCVISLNGMSECGVTSTKTQQSFSAQKICAFFEKAQFELRCMWEVYGEYCWNIAAQDNAKGK